MKNRLILQPLFLTRPNVCSMMGIAKAENSQLSGEVHTPVGPQTFMGLVGHHITLREGNFHEGLQYLALCRQRGLCAFPWKAERMQMNDSVVISYSGQQVSVPKEVADFLEQDRKRDRRRKSGTKGI